MITILDWQYHVQLQSYTGVMKTLTLSFKLQGTAHILGADWQWRIDDHEYNIAQGDSQFNYEIQMPVQHGWNTVTLTHDIHPNDLTTADDYSHVNIKKIMFDGFDMPYKLFAQSGSTAINPATNKIQYLYDMGELFVCKINFYYPIEMWTFAIPTKSKQGKIGWKYA